MAAIDVSHPSDHEGCDRRSAAHRSHRPDQWEGPPAFSAATCVDVCVACSRTLGRVHVVHFVSDAVSYFVFGESSLCRAALWCPAQVVVVRRAESLC